MKAGIKVLFIACVLLLLASCKSEVQISLYLSDLINIYVNHTKDFRTPATVSVEVPSSDKKDEALEIVSRYFREVENPSIAQKGMQSFLTFRTKLPIAYAGQNEDVQLPEIINMLVVKKDDTSIFIGCNINSPMLSQLNSYISDKYYQTFDVDDLDISLTINNDTQNDQSLIMYAVYIDGKALALKNEFVMKRRDERQVKLSNVLRDMIIENKLLPILQLKYQ